ncbi:MAG: alkaline phosphatase family protein [Anaerolineae bacterium]
MEKRPIYSLADSSTGSTKGSSREWTSPASSATPLLLAIPHLLLVALLLAGCTAAPAPTTTPLPPTETPRPTATAPAHTPAIAQAQTEASPTQTAAPTAPTPTTIETPEERALAERVLIISVDGLRPDALSESVSPNIVALAQAGAYTGKAQTVLPAVTLVSHASMLSGVSPARHGLTWNDPVGDRRAWRARRPRPRHPG